MDETTRQMRGEFYGDNVVYDITGEVLRVGSKTTVVYEVVNRPQTKTIVGLETEMDLPPDYEIPEMPESVEAEASGAIVDYHWENCRAMSRNGLMLSKFRVVGAGEPSQTGNIPVGGLVDITTDVSLEVFQPSRDETRRIMKRVAVGLREKLIAARSSGEE